MIPEKKLDQAVKDLFSQIEFQKEPAGLYDPLRYMIAIGGKRLRPRLCLTTYGFFADEFSPAGMKPYGKNGTRTPPSSAVTSCASMPTNV